MTMILIYIALETSNNTEQHKQTKWHVNMWENRNKSSIHKNLPVFLLIIRNVSRSFMLNNSLQQCWKHNTLYKFGESSQQLQLHFFHVVKFYCNMFQLMYRQPSLDWQSTKEKLSRRTLYIILHSVCLQPISQFTIP